MKVIFKPNLLVVAAQTDAEKQSLGEWALGADQHAFCLQKQSEDGFRLVDLGPVLDARREPINVISTASDPAIRLISNFAHTPFELDGQVYASVEGFWQGLKFPDRVTRVDVAGLHGGAARAAGDKAEAAEKIVYRGQTVRVGTHEHWHLMYLANQAKFTQHPEARAALESTRDRPLIHKIRRDSCTIPGVIMAEIWMKIRRQLRKVEEEPLSEEKK